MMSSDVCRICLAGNIKMHFIAHTQLQDIYEKLTSNQWSKDNRPLTICYLCHSLLRSCLQFREMSQMSEEAFTQFFACGFEFTEDTIPILNKRNLQKLLVTPVKTFTIGISNYSTNLEKEIKPNYETSSINQRKPQKMLTTPIKKLTIGINNSSREENTRKNGLQSKSTQTNRMKKMLVTPIATINIEAVSLKGTEVKEKITLQKTPIIKLEKCDITEKGPSTPENAARNYTIKYSPRDMMTDIPGTHEDIDHISSYEEKNSHSIKSKPLEMLTKGNGVQCGIDLEKNTDKTLKQENELENLHFFDKNDRTFADKNGVKNGYKLDNSQFSDINYRKFAGKNGVKNGDKLDNSQFSVKNDRTFADKNGNKLNTPKSDVRKSIPSFTLRFQLHNKNPLKTKPQSEKKTPYPFDIFGLTPEKLTKLLYPCNYCDESFKSFGHLESHLIIHGIDKSYTCKDCNKIFYTKSSLVQHMRIHNSKRSFPCNLCPKKFADLKHLNQHLKTHSEETPYICTICNKGFKQTSNLDQHYRTHTNERPFSCDVCGKTFKQQSNLLQHTRVHNGDKPFSCDECGKKFSQISNLNQHRRIHTGVKPYSCSECDKTFRQKSNLLQHVRVLHNSVGGNNFREGKKMLSTLTRQ